MCVMALCADRPVTYLYNTLHYYERHLRDRTNLKRKLVHAIMSSLKVSRDTHTRSYLLKARICHTMLVFFFLRTTVHQVGVSVKPT